MKLRKRAALGLAALVIAFSVCRSIAGESAAAAHPDRAAAPSADISRYDVAFQPPSRREALSLAQYEPDPSEPANDFEMPVDATRAGATPDPYASRAYGIGGPWRLRSADALRPGQLSIRNEMTWTTGLESGDDETRYGLSIDYGIAPMHHVTLELPVDIGDGAVTGNGDFRLGWHWQLLKEDDWKPSFALRNYIRVPSGYESSGVDYELRALFSKSVADHVRVHIAPFLESINGDNTEDVRHFQWGAAIGSDWKITDTLDIVVDYVHETSNETGIRNQHSLDAGVIWEVAPNHKIGISGSAGLDGDGVNGDWGAGIFYTIAFDGLPHLGRR
ncbi:hypothetical protein B7486_14440 [cyanobacterium TDX16]|nr:hypothetical protein B7486_14440 [cyanobacterium TDX16]